MAWWIAAFSWAVMLGHLSESWYRGFALFAVFALARVADALQASFYVVRRGGL